MIIKTFTYNSKIVGYELALNPIPPASKVWTNHKNCYKTCCDARPAG